jgi:UDP-N-acetyl-D-galactosamine dehydrogenase
MTIRMNRTIKICVIGLGYVGLPLARLFSTKYQTIGFDINEARVGELMSGHDYTLEVPDEMLREALANGFRCTTDPAHIRDCNFYIVTVPTPVDMDDRPDLHPLINASKTIGEVISEGDIVVYESTVYPGVTEEECLPVVEKISGLQLNKDFYAGYSPERINPGDKEHTIEKIKKVTSGSTPEAADFIDRIYNSVLVNGTHKAPSIRVAEASKVIENTQRDVNIAFMNELAKIFAAMDIDTQDVIEAASSKWNFIKLSPGLVGGHCIGIDPYYLIQKAQVYGVLPRIITSARRLNDGMGDYVASRLIRLMNKKGTPVKDAHILILGMTFKENCPDTRNTKVVDIYAALREYTDNVTIYDPLADAGKVKAEYGIEITGNEPAGRYDAILLAVAHKAFENMDIGKLLSANAVVYDVKGVLPRNIVDGRL